MRDVQLRASRVSAFKLVAMMQRWADLAQASGFLTPEVDVTDQLVLQGPAKR